MRLTPFLFERKILPKVWGGRALESTLGLELPADEAIGETWELYDRPDGSSKIRGSDRTLRDLMLDDSRALLGRGVRPTADGYFPLLIKFIDAADCLSVQVHPDDELARADGDSGKSEAWVVLGVGDNPKIVHGLRQGVTREAFAAAAHTAAVEEHLDAFAPEVGDSIYISSGTVHAIGPDVVLFEVQQNSDLTYRLYDWGRARETHVEKALQAIRFDSGGATDRRSQSKDSDAEWLFQNRHFTTRRLRVRTPASFGSEGSFKVLTVVGGMGTLGWHSAGEEPPIMLRQGDTVLVPSVIDVTFLSPIGEMVLLVCGPGERG